MSLNEVMVAAADLALAQLLQDGYCILSGALAPDLIADLLEELDPHFTAAPFSQGGFYGPRTKRFGALLRRAPSAGKLVMHPLILAIAEQVLGPWCDRINLNLAQAIELHPGAPAQFPHRDQDMWQGPKGCCEYLLNVMVPLTPFNAENGATRVWPGSHRAIDAGTAADEEAVDALMAPGSVLLFLGSTLHGAGTNRSTRPRRAVLISYCLGWLKPYENQWLCYPPEIARQFPPALAELVGYSLHRPNLGNYEGQSPAVLLAGEVPAYLPAIDALLPEQQAALEVFLAGQRAGRDPS